ncbi:hypothetical protein H112_02586 [Trichophyton rubrum D6]|uniref:Uncharacterized protein n=3 Tax=Trichophyton TaxID=5550 RepID=A0A080WW53_TRIRC|nr:uncharacterized protein TERG_06347 [Trichophyton rubrum CBS 118892]EZF24947.1 hypothetical protein H100_02592 [Trichophyton rubrum MR850]EZF43946.1 hypothetical protein H102_02583 [Trichophyton rubrum CBS 100081]EZF54610.1 hypothetical protein H103_02598 [Trichophyton rubrum CBS 288.86]EZF65186.1 hypothetical protein H104_02575 [Trichophyton rubrum CBS 289.86]EZF75885.1 hypothetical protein H105_02601 [Trichophyton soudanense CBS 452.61]EZF86507.1 hypothetical protein H110_02592 [Trichophy
MLWIEIANQTNQYQATGGPMEDLNNEPFADERGFNGFGKTASAPERKGSEGSALGSSLGSSPPRDRRMSKEWDAAQVPPSRFQKKEGSIFSTAGSRDSHITRRDRDHLYHAKLKEKVGFVCVSLGWTQC